MTTATYQPTDDRRALRSQNDNLKALPSILKSEWIKLSTIRSNTAILALTVVLNAVVSWAIANFVTDEGELFVDKVFAFSTLFTAVFAAVAGILIVSSEVQHGTLAPTLTARPARLALATAKTLIAAAFGAVLGTAGLIAGLVGASVSGIETGDASTIIGTSLWAILLSRWHRYSVSESAWWPATAPSPSPVFWSGGWSSRTCSTHSSILDSPASSRSSPTPGRTDRRKRRSGRGR